VTTRLREGDDFVEGAVVVSFVEDTGWWQREKADRHRDLLQSWRLDIRHH
jgi:hypothetical protein